MNIVEINSILERNDTYILALANSKVFRNSTYTDTLKLERDELAQRVRIKLWHALEKQPIIPCKMYIRQIVQHEFIDMLRQKKVMLPLSFDEEEDLISGSVLHKVLTANEEDPSKIVEEKESVAEYLTWLAYHTVALPPHQRYAMICRLKDEVDDVLQLTKAFKAHSISIEAFSWPEEKQEEHNLKASLAPARKKLEPLREKLLISA